LRDIGDARIALEDVGQGEVPNLARSEPTATRNRYLPLGAAGVVLLAGVVAALILGFRKPATPSEVPVRFALPIDGRIVGDVPEPSPDGHYVAAAVVDSSGNRRLWVRPIDSDRGRVLEGTDGADGPFWSADARWIGFYAAGRLKRVSPAGGSPQTIAEVPALFGSPTWNAAGDIVYAPINRSGLFRIRDSGGTPQQVTTLDATRMENSHRWPRFLPDGRHFVFTARCTTAANNAVYIGSLDTGETRRLTHVESQVYFTQPPDGATALLFVREGTLFRQPLAGETLTGVPTAIAEHVLHNTIGAEAGFAASADGRVLIVREAGAGGRIPTWYRRNGTAIESMVAGQYNEIRLSPDGSHLLFDRPDSDYGNRDVWSMDLSRGTMFRLTNNPANDLEPIWSPDGRRILFASDRAGGPAMNFFSKSAYDISGAETKIEGTPKGQFDLMDMSSDGRWIALTPHAPPDTDIWIVPSSNGPKAFPLVETPSAEFYPRFSPDGKWIAYSSDDSGRREVYVRPFPARGSDAAAIQVSHVGAEYPVWSADTTELFYLAADFKMYSVPARQFGAATPDARPLFTACPSSQPVTGPLSGSVYDVARDGRFLVLCLSPQNGFVVTVNPTSLR
jgi:Tol biopolymer transport system component